MSLLFHRTETEIKGIYDDFKNSKLTVDSSYQRRKVWLPQDKVRLIETVLLGLVIPEVFFWPAEIDAETGDAVTHIVDGQQRISSIVEFISGEFPLASKYLMDSVIIERCGNKFFAELSSADKTGIWRQKISVVNIDASFTKHEIKNMFYRLNLTNYTLNEQERLHSKESAFGDAATALSELEFWEKSKVFSSADARRMQDVRFCSSIYILANEGVVDQTNSSRINAYYDDFTDAFDSDLVLYKKIESAMEFITKLTDKTTISFVSKKAQMYSLFSAVFKMLDDGLSYSNEVFERFKFFVMAYSCFRNEYDLQLNEPLRSTNESVKRYKLASSEGLNKLANRVIRLEILYNVLTGTPPDLIDIFKQLERVYREHARSSTISLELADGEDMKENRGEELL